MSERRYTFEEFRQIVVGITGWGNALRLYYNREVCDCCGAAYHPRDGEPPHEDACDKEDCYCGHAGMREMHAYWDYEKNDWSDW